MNELERMVMTQIESRGVLDSRVLDAMKKLDRRQFVPHEAIQYSYNDSPLPIGYGQTISQPYIVALMSELCELDGAEKVLEIGTGSGYQTAILAMLAKEVHTVEIIDILADRAKDTLERVNINNVTIYKKDGYDGLPEKAPFDVIIITAAPPEIPEYLLSQLKTDGIMVLPVGREMQELVRIRKKINYYERETVSYVRFVPMVHKDEE